MKFCTLVVVSITLQQLLVCITTCNTGCVSPILLIIAITIQFISSSTCSSYAFVVRTNHHYDCRSTSSYFTTTTTAINRKRTRQTITLLDVSKSFSNLLPATTTTLQHFRNRKEHSHTLLYSASSSSSSSSSSINSRGGIKSINCTNEIYDNETNDVSEGSSRNTTTTNTIIDSIDSFVDTEQVPLFISNNSVSTTTTSTSKTSITNKLTISLIKSIVGSGVLALPAGVVAIAGTNIDFLSSIPYSWCITLIIGYIYWYYFQLVGSVCIMTNSTSYTEAWEKTIGTKFGTIFVNLCIIIKPALGCIAYSIILADSIHSLCIATGIEFVVDNISRTSALLGITLTAILPLCLLQSLTSLTIFSLIGLLCILFITCIMGIRSIDGTYNIDTGIYTNQLLSTLQPSFDTSSLTTVSSDYGIVLACTLCTAFVCHYNSPRFLNELKLSLKREEEEVGETLSTIVPSSTSFLSSTSSQVMTNTNSNYNSIHNNNNVVKSSDNPNILLLDQFQIITTRAYIISGILYCIIATVGYITFGYNSSSNILNNYSSYDPYIILARIALTISILATYPLPFVGLRDGITDLLQLNKNNNNKSNAILSIGILSIITVIATIVTDLQFILAIGGATFSTAVACVFPTLMYRSAVQQQKGQQQQQEILLLGNNNNNTNTFNEITPLVFMVLSILLGISGVTLAIQNAFG